MANDAFRDIAQDPSADSSQRLFFVKHIPHDRSNKSEDDPDDKNCSYQHRRRSKIKRINFIGWSYEMKSKDKINETLRPAEPHQDRPKQMPNSADYPKH